MSGVWAATLLLVICYMVFVRGVRSLKKFLVLSVGLVALILWVPRVYVAKIARLGEGPSFGQITGAFLEVTGYLTPFGEFVSIAAIAGSTGIGIFLARKYRDQAVSTRERLRLALATVACGTLTLVAASLTGRAAARYGIPPVYMFGFSFFVIVGLWVKRWSALVSSSLIVSIGMFSVGNIYRQTVAYQQMLYEFQEVVGYLTTVVQISWAEQRRLLKTREKASPKGCSGDQVAALDKIEIMLLSQLGLHSRQ